MNTKTRTTTVLTTGVAAICIGGPWAASPADATTDSNGGGGAAPTSRVSEIDEVVAMRKAQMAHDYVEYAAARAAYQEGGLRN
jgi:hypothetical protein